MLGNYIRNLKKKTTVRSKMSFEEHTFHAETFNFKLIRKTIPTKESSDGNFT